MRAKHWYLAAACAAAICALVAQTAAASVLQAPPTLTGTPYVGETVTAHAGTFDTAPPFYSFTFLRCPVSNPTYYSQCTEVKSTPYTTSDTATYTLTAADLGRWLFVMESDDYSNWISDAFGKITPVPPVNDTAPAISGVAQVGRVLVGTTGTWTPSSGLTYQEAWFRCPAGTTGFTGCSVVSQWNAGNLTYVPLAADVGSVIRLSVSASDGYTTVGAPAAPTDPVVDAASGGPADVDSLTPPTFTTTLHPGQSATSSQSLHLAQAPAKADIVLGFDTTASMQQAIDEAKLQAHNLVGSMQALIPGARFAVADFQDYPQSPFIAAYGVSDDHPYKLWQPLTADPSAVQSAIDGLTLGSGGDIPEAYDRMFYEGYADPALGFDPHAEKFLVVLGDSYPHERDSSGSVAPCPVDGLPDLGPDGVRSGDDLTSQSTLAGLVAAHETLLFVTYNNNTTHIASCHEALAATTGGNDVLDSTSSSLAQEIEGLVLERAQHVDAVSLTTEPAGYSSWVSFEPAGSWSNVSTPADLPFTETVTPPAGTAPGTYSFTVDAVADGVSRASQTVTVTVPAPPTVSVADVSAQEGAPATFDLTLSKAWDDPVTVAWTTTDGTATAGSDYAAGSGTVTFAPGETSKQVTVQTTDDTLDEPDETFNVVLSNPSNATLGASTAVATIADDDPAPSLVVTGGSATEGDTGTSPATFTVSLSAASGKTVTVDYATADGTATAGSDYDATAGTLTFAPGETSKTVTTTVDGDTAFEGNETFHLVLSNPVDAAGTPSGTWTILDDDNRPPVCDDATVTPSTLWSPNGKFVTVTVGGCTDPDHDALAYSIVKVQQDEAPGAQPDAKPVAGHPNQVQLRAERLGTGNGRVYVVTFMVSDGHGAPVKSTVEVLVPHDQAHKTVDSGVRFDSGL